MTKNRAGKPPSQRQLKVGEQVRKVLADAMHRGDFFDPDLDNATITVTEVSVSPDLRNGVVYVMPLGNVDGDVVVKALNRNANRFKHFIAKSVDMRAHPRLFFALDTAFDYAGDIARIMNSDRVQQDVNKTNGDTTGDES
jgi:ribosome-binding factor A